MANLSAYTGADVGPVESDFGGSIGGTFDAQSALDWFDTPAGRVAVYVMAALGALAVLRWGFDGAIAS